VPDVLEIPLRGPKGEPVDFARTIVSHGVAELPPNRVDLAGRALETTLPAARGARTVRITEHERKLRIEGSSDLKLTKTVAHVFRLDEDLSGFYELVREDELAWCATGAGRMLRAPTVFEDVVKTICTTNTSCLGRRGWWPHSWRTSVWRRRAALARFRRQWPWPKRTRSFTATSCAPAIAGRI
jgi:hypothetical protein